MQNIKKSPTWGCKPFAKAFYFKHAKVNNITLLNLAYSYKQLLIDSSNPTKTQQQIVKEINKLCLHPKHPCRAYFKTFNNMVTGGLLRLPNL